MEKYVSAADRVARARALRTAGDGADADAAALRGTPRRAKRGRFPASYDVTGLSLPNAFHAIHRVPVDGEYMIKVVLGGLRPKASMPVTVALWVDRKQVQTRHARSGRRRVVRRSTARTSAARPSQFRVRLTAGDRWIVGGDPAHLRGPAAALRRAEPVDAPRAAARVQAAAERAAGAARACCASGSTRRRRRAREDSAERRPRERGRSRRAVLARRTGRRARAWQKIYTCGHLDGAHQPHVRAAHRDRPRAARLPPAGRDARSREVHRARPARRRRKKARSTKGWRSASRRSWCRPTSCSASSAIGRLTAGGHLAPDHAARAGDAAVVLPLGEHARRRAAARGRRRHAARSADPRVAGPAHAARSEGARARGALRRPVAAVPRARIGHARSRALPGLRGLPPAVDAARDRAVRRAHRPRGPQRPRLHRRPLLVPQRAAGAALRDPERRRARSSAASI